MEAAVIITGRAVLCEGTTAVLTAPSGMRSYLWNTGETTQTVLISSGGVYKVTTIDQSFKRDSGSIEVRVVPNPTPVLNSAPIFLCEGETATLYPPGFYTSYRWNTGDTTSNIQVSKTGDYWLTVTDSNGCVGTSNAVHVDVTSSPISLITGPDTACRNSLTIFSIENDTSASYQWLIDGGTIVSGNGTSQVEVLWQRSGSIQVRVSKLRPDFNSCLFITSKFVDVSARVKPTLIYTRSSFCEGSSIILDASPGYTSYRWSTGQTAESIIVTEGGVYWVEAKDTSGCWGVSDSITVVVFPLPDITIDGPGVVCSKDQTPVSLSASSSGNDVVLWKWNTGETTPTISNATPGTYFVVGTTINGCVDTAWKTVSIGKEILATASDINFGIVPIGAPYSGVATLSNRGTTDISVIDIIEPPSITISNPLPEYIRVGDSTDFYASVTAQGPGPFSGTIWFVIRSADCYDTIPCLFSGTADGYPPPDTTFIILSDTIVDVGAVLAVPVYIYKSNPSIFRDANVAFQLTFDPKIFDLRSVDGANYFEVSSTPNTKTFEFSLPFRNFPDTVYLNGLTLLSLPFQTPLQVSNERMEPSAQTQFTHRDGSITTRGCWLPGRIVTLVNMDVRLVISTLHGSVIYNNLVNNLDDTSLRDIINSLNLPNQPLAVVVFGPSGAIYNKMILLN